jgi:peptide/nickel transport system ATP-binding protein
MDDLLLNVQGLKTHFFLDEGTVRAVEGVDLRLRRGGTLGVVGESGCGKSVTAFSILQLVSRPGRIVAGQILFRRIRGNDSDGPAVVDLAALAPRGKEMRSIRGRDIAMIFQEPMTSLSPVHTIGHQISEVVRLHYGADKRAAEAQTVEMLRRVGIPRPAERLHAYPFQLSGGMRQRAMIAMALACRPSLLIADEPTTALDVTIQAQIMELLRELQAEMGMAVMIITHNLGVVAEMCQDVAVMYLGQVVEQADVAALFRDPLHPYTRALLRSIPKLGQSKNIRLDPIAGSVPDPFTRPPGCTFHPRCLQQIPGLCESVLPPWVEQADGRGVRCHLYSVCGPDAGAERSQA